MDSLKIFPIAERILKGMCEYFRCKQFTRNCFTAIQSSLLLFKSISLRTWCDMTSFYKHLDVTDEVTIRLKFLGFGTLSMLLQAKPDEIESVCSLFIQMFYIFLKNGS